MIVLEMSTAVGRSAPKDLPVSLVLTRLRRNLSSFTKTTLFTHSFCLGGHRAGPAMIRSVFIDGGLCEVADTILRGIAYLQVPRVFKPMRV